MFIRTLILRLVSSISSMTLVTGWLNKILRYLNAGGQVVAKRILEKGVTKGGLKELLNPKNWKEGTWIKGLIALDAMVLANEGINWVSDYINEGKGDREAFEKELRSLNADEETISQLLTLYDEQMAAAEQKNDIIDGELIHDRNITAEDLKQNLIVVRAMEDDLINLAALLGVSKGRAFEVARLVGKVNANLGAYRLLV